MASAGLVLGSLGLLLLLSLPAGRAVIHETFTKNIETGVVAPSSLFVQTGELVQGGRGGDSTSYAVRLTSELPPLETTSLTWDGESKALDFFYDVECGSSTTDVHASFWLKVQISQDGRGMTWTNIWGPTTFDKVPHHDWTPVRIDLPLTAASPGFAVKWLVGGSHWSGHGCSADIDDITLPALPPTDVRVQAVDSPPGPVTEGPTGNPAPKAPAPAPAAGAGVTGAGSACAAGTSCAAAVGIVVGVGGPLLTCIGWVCAAAIKRRKAAVTRDVESKGAF